VAKGHKRSRRFRLPFLAQGPLIYVKTSLAKALMVLSDSTGVPSSTGVPRAVGPDRTEWSGLAHHKLSSADVFDLSFLIYIISRAVAFLRMLPSLLPSIQLGTSITCPPTPICRRRQNAVLYAEHQCSAADRAPSVNSSMFFIA